MATPDVRLLRRTVCTATPVTICLVLLPPPCFTLHCSSFSSATKSINCSTMHSLFACFPSPAASSLTTGVPLLVPHS
uniref:Putative secreted peptide n=1 Tax=Anopheles braziliensis TaxID=58242 RepID=A0A2M3ZPL0_9DIPT